MVNVIGKSIHIMKRLHRKLANDSLSALQELQIAIPRLERGRAAKAGILGCSDKGLGLRV
jgi:hypothetical protein